MDILVIIGVAFGSLFTWCVSKYFYDQKRRRYLRETTEQMESSIKNQDTLYALTASAYLRALQDAESGNLNSAKQELADGLANFYQQFSGSDYSSLILAQKRDIDIYAKKSEVLRSALENIK